MTDKNDIQFPLQWNSIITKQATGAQFQSREYSPRAPQRSPNYTISRSLDFFDVSNQMMLEAVAMTPSQRPRLANVMLLVYIASELYVVRNTISLQATATFQRVRDA
jgi:hypothetical protein